MIPEAILIYAAGLGTRMGPLTADRPKPLIVVKDRPLIDHALALTAPLGPLRRVVNVHYRADQVRDHLQGRDIAFSDETDVLRETGGGLKHAGPLLGAGPVFTLNTDAVWHGPNPLLALRDAWRPDEMDGLVVLVRRENAIGHSGAGDFIVDADGRLTRGPGHVYAGAQIVTQDRFQAETETVFSTNLIWDRMIADVRLFGMVYDGSFADVGRPEAISAAEALLEVGANV